ncbi:MAG: metallophosphoesterase family protein [Lentisphaeria bacterium]
MPKVGFISDIHGNIDALQAILKRLDEEDCDMVVCLGDVVGYGGCPAECINLLREKEIPTVKGNHDDYVSTFANTRVNRLRNEIQQSIQWTQSHLSFEDLAWLGKLPMRLKCEYFTALHASFCPHPLEWSYCLDEETFAINFKFQDAQLGFCGHSHSPLIGIETKDGKPYVDFIHRIKVPTKQKVMINIGSAGQPRDRDTRACAATFDLTTRELKLVRAEYDIIHAQAKIREAGLPEKFASRLEFGR